MGIFSGRYRKLMRAHLEKLGNFCATQEFMGTDGSTGIAIDEQRKTLCLLTYNTGFASRPVTARVIEYKDVLSSELLEDANSVSVTRRSANLGGAVLGALTLGAPGMIVGGLAGTSRTTTSGKVRRVSLRVTVNDIAAPLHEVSFLTTEVNKEGFTSIVYQEAMKQARHWQGLIDVIIKRADLECEAAAREDAPGGASGSLADELKKLAELRDTGVLTEEEFHLLKSRIINR